MHHVFIPNLARALDHGMALILLASIVCMGLQNVPHGLGQMFECSPGELLPSAAFLHRDDKWHCTSHHYAALKGLNIWRSLQHLLSSLEQLNYSIINNNVSRQITCIPGINVLVHS